jgi:hypothetical protein
VETDQKPETGTAAPEFGEWAFLEVMGHRELAGRVTVEVIADAKFIRIDIPSDPPATQFYMPRSVFSITPTTEEIARAAARQSRGPAPIQRWELEAADPDDDPNGRAW